MGDGSLVLVDPSSSGRPYSSVSTQVGARKDSLSGGRFRDPSGGIGSVLHLYKLVRIVRERVVA